ncbi:MAG: carboxypeptidase-like regulatory domain-containing protein [Planctomycetaceae bacterium]
MKVASIWLLVLIQVLGQHISFSPGASTEGQSSSPVDFRYYTNLVETHTAYLRFQDAPDVAARLAARKPATENPDQKRLRTVVEFADWLWSTSKDSANDSLIGDHLNRVIKADLITNKDPRFVLKTYVTWANAEKRSKVVIGYAVHKATGDIILPKCFGPATNLADTAQQISEYPRDAAFRKELQQLNRKGCAGIWHEADSGEFYMVLPSEDQAHVTRLGAYGKSEDLAICTYSGDRLVTRSRTFTWSGEMLEPDRMRSTTATRGSDGRLRVTQRSDWRRLSEAETKDLLAGNLAIRNSVRHKGQKGDGALKNTLITVGLAAILGLAAYNTFKNGPNLSGDGGGVSSEPQNPPKSNGKIAGRLLDKNGKPIGGAKLTIPGTLDNGFVGSSTITDASGRFSLFHSVQGEGWNGATIMYQGQKIWSGDGYDDSNLEIRLR